MAQGVAKRATISIGFHVDQSAIDKFEHSLKDIDRDNTNLREAFDRTDSSLDRFYQHIEQLTGRNNEAMDRLRRADNQAAEANRHLGTGAERTAAIHNRASQRIINGNNQARNSSRQNANQQINDNHRIGASSVNMSREQYQALMHQREAYRQNAQAAKEAQDRIGSSLHNQTREQYQAEHATGAYSREMRRGNEISNQAVTANGRLARSTNSTNTAMDRHVQAIRDAQGRSYHWLRTCQDMAGATLGLGAAFYKGAKEATSLQQSYVHAGNMAHYGGEKVSQVQHDINQQWSAGAGLSTKYGISQQQIAQGYQALVARGYTTNESLHTQKSLLQAAIASGDNYNDVVKDSTNVLDAYNMRSKNAATMTNNTKKVVNQMAYAADQTATNFQGLGIGMSYVAATAHTTHQSISETSSALGILSNKGMQASQAGTGLRKVLNSFLSINKKGQQAQVMQQLGLSENDFKTASGHLKSLGSLMSLLNNKTKNMDSQERGAVFHRFFGATGQEAALNLASDTKDLRKLNNEVQRSQNMGHGKGYVAMLSAHNMQSAQNQINRFRMAWQEFTVTSAREILPDLTDILKHLDRIIYSMQRWPAAGKKAAVVGALIIAGISPVAGVVFGVQSAFHGLEMTIAKTRRMFARPVSSTMQKSMAKQGLGDNAIAHGEYRNLSKGKDAGKLGLMARLAQHPTGVGVAGAGALALGMGTFMGVTANKESANQVRNQMKHAFSSPIQERIKATLDTASARQSLEANGKLNKQLLKQNKSAYASMENNLKNYSKQNASQSAKNLKTLQRNGMLSKKQAAQRLKYDQSANKNMLKNADRAINSLSRDEARSDKNGYMSQIRTQKNELNADKKHYKALQSQELLATGKRRQALQKQLRGILSDEEKHARSVTALQRKSEAQRKNDLNRAQTAIDHVIAGNGSKANQIFRRLQQSRGRISTQTAARLLRDAYRTSRGEINSANKAYSSAKSAAWKKYNTVTKAAAEEYGTSSSEYKKIRASAAATRDSTINSANTKRKMTIQAATEEHDRTVQEAESQCKGISSAVDVGTGHVITEWQKMETWVENIGHGIEHICSEVGSALNNLTGGLAGKLGSAMSDISSAASKAGSFGKGHAVGGAIPQNEMSLVNEKGRESAYNPTTNKFRLFPNNGPQVIPLYAGEHVLTAQDTRELLTTGMGRGVTLPGYANGTDTLNNVRNSRKAKQLHSYAMGTGRAGAISQTASDEGNGGENMLHGLEGAEETWNPYGWAMSASQDVPGMFRGNLESRIKSGLGAAGDTLSSPLKLGHVAPVLRHLTNSKPLIRLGTRGAHAAKNGLHDIDNLSHFATNGLEHAFPKLGDMTKGLLRHLDPFKDNRLARQAFPRLKAGAGALWNKLGKPFLHSNIMQGIMHPLHTLHDLGKKLSPGIRRFGRNVGKTASKAWNGLKRGLGRGVKSAARLGRGAMRDIKRFGRNLGRTAGKAWNGLKRNTGRAWRGLKRNAGRMLKGAQRMGRGAMRGMRRFGRNVGRGIRRFGRNTMRAGRRIARNVGRGVRRFGRGLARTGRRMFRNASRGIRRFGRNVMRQGRRIYRGGRRLVGRAWRGLKRFGKRAINGAKRVGKRIWSSAKGTAKRVWNAAKSTGKNVWSNAKKVGSDVSSAARSLWSKTKSGAEATWSTVKSGASAAWSRIRSGASEMASAVRSKVSDLVSAAKSKAESAWSTIKSGASAAASAAKSVIGSIVSFAASVVSRVKSMISSIHMPHLASGGPIRDTTMALVGEHGVETAYNRSTGSIRFLGVHGPQITTLLAGERVLTNTQTERLLHGGLGRGIKLPAFAKGTGNTAAELDNSNSHSAPSSSTMSITGSFSGVSALKEMLSFGKKSKSIWGDISDNVVKAVTDARTESGTQWTGLSKDVGDINDKMSKATSTSFQDMGQKVNKLVSDLSEGLVEAAKDTASGFGDKFGDLITYAKSDVKKVIAAINRGISGIDTALRSFGGNSHVIHQIHYATGTMNGRIAYPQLGILNDATTGPKQEAIVRGNQIMLPQGDNVRIPLQRGDAVLNGDQTKELINHTTNINHYASGSGIHLSSRMIKGMTNILKTATKSPATAFRRYVGNDIKPSGHPFTQGIESMIAKPVAKLGVPWTKAMFSYIQSLLTPPDDGSGANLNASDSNGSELLAEAEKLGAAAHNRYVWGANGPSAYDCGGLVLAALHHFGYTSDDRQTIIDHFPRESRADALPGDLVENGEHEGIVADKGAHHYYSAFNPAEGIKMYPLDQTHWTADDPTMRFARIDMAPRTSTAPKAKKNKESALQRLVASELGSSATSWLKKAAELFAGGGDADFNTMHIPGGEGGWTKRGSQAWNMARDVFYAAKSLGLDAKHAAAVVGNAWHESAGFQYGLMVNQFGGGGGKGLFQFTGQPSKDGWTPLGQTKSILENATPGQESGWKHEDESTYKLAEDFETIFERGSIPAYAARAQAADTAYDMFAANGGWADKNHQRIFGEAGPEVAINPARDSADHLIIQAIGARMRNSPNSPIAGLVKSLGIKDKAHSLINGIKGLLTGSTPKPQHNNNPIKINVTNNITIQGNPGTNQAHQITRNVEKAIQRGIQRAALRTRNRLDW